MKDLHFLGGKIISRVASAFSIILIAINAYAGLIPEPPIIKDKDTRNYFRTLYNNYNNLEIVTTTPNGNRNGKRGDMVLYVGATQTVVSICVSSPNGTQWLSMPLTIVP